MLAPPPFYSKGEEDDAQPEIDPATGNPVIFEEEKTKLPPTPEPNGKFVSKDPGKREKIYVNGVDVTILADGVNSLLTSKAVGASVPKLHEMAVGVKELIELPSNVIEDRLLCAPGEGASWLFAGDATHGRVGGAFMYTNKDSISLGLVATLSDLVTAKTPIYQMFSDFKKHPAVAPLIKGGTTVEYSGHMVPEGGFNMLPKLVCDGCMVTGDAGMLCINLGYAVRGMDFAVSSGDMAAQAAVEALIKHDVSVTALHRYVELLEGSYVLKDLKQFRKFPRFMEGTKRIFDTYPAMMRDMMKGSTAKAVAAVRAPVGLESPVFLITLVLLGLLTQAAWMHAT